MVEPGFYELGLGITTVLLRKWVSGVTKQDTPLGLFPVNWLNAHNQLGDSVRQGDAELKPELPKPASVVMQQVENFCILKIKKW